MNILTAHNQWAKRPDDERFWNLAEMKTQLDYMRTQACELTFTYGQLLPVQGPNLIPTHTRDAPLHFTHDAFTRYCADLSIPHDYARRIGQSNPALLCDMLLDAHDRHSGRAVKYLVHQNGTSLVRALTGPKYQRVWHSGLVEFCQALEDLGWQVPPARPSGAAGASRTRLATEHDVLAGNKSGLSIRVGDTIAPAGLYASWTDMFVFMVDEHHPIMLPGRDTPMYRAFMLADATDGTASLRFTAFLYDVVCGNHILWSADQVADLRIRHQGDGAYAKLTANQSLLLAWASAGTANILDGIRYQQSRLLGSTQEEVIDACHRIEIPRKLATEAYALALVHEQDHGDPRSAWGMMSGLTRLSQTRQAGDTVARMVIDTQAARLLA